MGWFVADPHLGTTLAVAIVMTAGFRSHLDWSGAAKGTRDLATLNRDVDVTIEGFIVPMSAASEFGGNPARINPEQMYVASVSACYALTFLFLAARAQMRVIGYSDDAVGELAMTDGKMRMTSVTLRPHITLATGTDPDKARGLVQQAHRQCFIGNSVLATVNVEPVIACHDKTEAVSEPDCDSVSSGVERS